MDNPEELASKSTQEKKNKAKTQHIMCWTPPHANKHK